MEAKILNQPWEDVADDVTSAIEKAVQPLLKKAVDDIYGGLLDATQDYLKDNLAFNIASRIDVAEREAATARRKLQAEREAKADLVRALIDIRDLPGEINLSNYNEDDVAALNASHIEAYQIAVAAIAKALNHDA